ncbi:MAG: hypothetical protein QOF02_3604 [Blastocatellia bacterium]|jgi:hypothetical protein|nr:hypothetical protein [Blastocatellia bacterium]
MLARRNPIDRRLLLLLLSLLLLQFAFPGLTGAQVKQKARARVTKKTSDGKRKSKDGARQRQPVALSSKQEPRAMTQTKIDSQLLYLMKIRRGEKSPVADSQALERSIKIDGQGRALVDVEANVSDALLLAIQSLGGEIISSFKQFNSVRVNFPVDKLEELAALRDIKFIRPAAAPQMDTPVHG